MSYGILFHRHSVIGVHIWISGCDQKVIVPSVYQVTAGSSVGGEIIRVRAERRWIRAVARAAEQRQALVTVAQMRRPAVRDQARRKGAIVIIHVEGESEG